MKSKILFTLNVEYPKAITDLTHPRFRSTAQKYKWDFVELTRRLHPEWPVTYEKFQIYDYDWDWALFIDSDAVIHPKADDWTLLDPNVVWVGGILNQQIRWINRPPTAFPTYCVVVSRECREVWRPPEMTPQEVQAQWLEPAFPEVVPASHSQIFVDDYTCSMNAHRFNYPVRKLNKEQVFHQPWLPTSEKAVDIAEWLLWADRE
jgi:hypothetical protein